MASRFSNPFVQFLDGNGDPLPGSKLEFFLPGTTTQTDTFSDNGLTTPNTNPIIADSDGRMGPIYLDDITYKVVLSTAADVVIATADPIGALVEGQFELWNNDITYSIPDLVTGSDDCFYRSLTDSNAGNNPTTSAVNWEKLSLGRIWNTNVTYASGDSVYGSDGKLYLSLTSSNSGNDPTGDIVNWGPAITNFPTQSTGDNTTLAATTAFVQTEISPSASAISGLVPSNAADADHDTTISTGDARDSAGAKSLALSSTITKQIDSSWVVGNDMGGLFSGTVAADTTYHLFIIEQDSDGLIDAGFDTSLTAANIPTGYTAFRRVASFLTDASANLLGFVATEISGSGLRVDYDLRVQDVSNTSPGTAANTASMTVPSGIPFLLNMDASLNDAANASIYITSLTETDVAADNTHQDLRVSSGSGWSTTNLKRMTNTSGQIRYRSSLGAGLTNFFINTRGFDDFRR